jgi:hypothetical protein
MSGIFTFDDLGEELHFPRARRDTVSSLNSFDDRWQNALDEERCASPVQEDIKPQFRHFGWDKSAIAEEECSSSSRTGSPYIPIPKRSRSCSQSSISSAEMDGLRLNRKMVPTDFEHVKVLGKGGYCPRL